MRFLTPTRNRKLNSSITSPASSEMDVQNLLGYVFWDVIDKVCTGMSFVQQQKSTQDKSSSISSNKNVEDKSSSKSSDKNVEDKSSSKSSNKNVEDKSSSKSAKSSVSEQPKSCHTGSSSNKCASPNPKFQVFLLIITFQSLSVFFVVLLFLCKLS